MVHHVTQRGNARQFILTSDSERSVYLGLLHESAQRCCLSVVGYCLMSNHVHLVVIPRKTESLASTFKATHGQYASYWNAAHRSSGHLWQGRFYSCRLDPAHLWEALRYTELNPVRAGMVQSAELWKWSSAAVHCVPQNQMHVWRWDRGVNAGLPSRGEPSWISARPKLSWH